MFEQATLTNGPAGARAWTTFLGLSSQIALVSLAVLAPMMWPQMLPTAHILEILAPPLPPGPRPKHAEDVKQVPASGRVLRAVPMASLRYYPPTVPTQVYTIVDEPAAPWVSGSPAGSGDINGSIVGNILDGVRNSVGVALPPPIVRPAPKPADVSPVIPRLRQGGDVHLGALLRKAEPQYPSIAKAAHVSGIVELECVVGVDGHIKEVKVKSGNALLIRAAVDAAWQWVYAPSKLNGNPIEIITNLTFTFKLN